MGPGHFGVAFAVKPFAPQAPLWALLVASEALDILSFGFIAIGAEKMAVSRVDLLKGIQTISPGSVPWSHGLFMAVIWSLLAGIIAHLVFHNRRASVAIAMVLFSHWVLDFIVHDPDLPLFFDTSHVFGLGLWTSGPGIIISCILEIALLTIGVAIYLNARRRKTVQEYNFGIPG